jgi:hypothetical protein
MPKRKWFFSACNWHYAGVLTALCLIVAPCSAFAHVKWFCNYNVAEQPVLLENVVTDSFCELVILAILTLTAGVFVEVSSLGASSLRVLNRLTAPIQANIETLLRATYGGFFVALWTKGGIILTPELNTSALWIPCLQLLIAAGMLWRATLPLSGFGIVVLFSKALSEYGLFHLMDYPIFLGAAGYLILMGTERRFCGIRPVDMLRYAAALTLMWASIEKWAYPQWTYPLFVSHPTLSFGFSRDFYMQAAGVVEFSLAFALCWTPLARRVAGLILTAMFVSAIFEFGKIDAIGHAPIVVILIAIVADDAVMLKCRPALAGAWYAIGVTSFIGSYYALHSLLFGTAIL